ncbi:MAG: ABC transporter ATP-binding protein [Anaerolineae bacterium]|nr:ABC transporter ATP-binding protein [Anaerolineae bacterium]
MRNDAKVPPVVVQIRDMTKTYTEGGVTRTILDSVNLDVHEGEFFVLLGKSGSGKSTLLNLVSGIDLVDSGSIVIHDTDITRLNDRQLTLFRRAYIGFVFQFFNLIPTLTVLENIMLPLELSGQYDLARKRGKMLLERVGLADRAATYPDRISGGEQQRVAIARALVSDPALVLADEPTGNLDEETGERVLDLLLEITRSSGKTLMMATHNPEIVPLADVICRIHEGKLVVSQPHTVEESSL